MPEGKISLGLIRPAYRGEYDASRNYAVMEVVSCNGYLFECISPAMPGMKPQESSDCWLNISKNGKAIQPKWEGTNLCFVYPDEKESDSVNLLGPQGEKGLKGETGDPGHSPGITSDFSCAEEDTAFSAYAGKQLYDMLNGKGAGGVVVAPPEIAIGLEVSNIADTQFSATGKCLLPGNRKISKFVLSVPELEIKNQEFLAENNSAILSFRVPETVSFGTTITVTVKAVDDLGNESPEATVVATVKDVAVEAAQIIYPTQNAQNVSLSPTIQVSAFGVIGGIEDTPKSIRVQIATDPAFENIAWDSEELEPSENISVPISLERKSVYYVRSRWTGNNLGQGSWGKSLEFETADIIIAKPTIISPENGASVVLYNGLNLVSSEFMVDVGEDEHDSTSWKVFSDDKGQNVALEDLDSTDLISHTFDVSTLIVGNNYYASCQHNGKSGVKSEWASLSTFLIVNGYSCRGCIYYRDESNQGTIIEYYWPGESTRRRFLLADASYRRLNMTADTVSQPSGLSELMIGTKLYSTDLNEHTILPSDLTNQYILNKFYNNLSIDKTAKYNCDRWMSVSGTKNPGVVWCRSKNINGKPLDLPNILQLMIIFILADELDAIDPTASSYPNHKIGMTGPTGRFSFGSSLKLAGSKAQMQGAWSSSAYQNTPPGYNEDVCYNGNIYMGSGHASYFKAALPVLEL